MRIDVRALVGRVETLYPVRLGRAYGESQAGNYAAGLAFNMLMSMFPLMLGLLAIVGLVLRSPQRLAQVRDALLTFFPPDAQGTLLRTLEQVRQSAGLLGIVGVVGLVWAGSGLFVSMEFALGEMLGAKQRDFVRQRLMAFTMTLTFVVALVAAVLLNTALGVVRTVPLLNPVLGALVWVSLMVVIYRVVPNRTFSTLRQVWPGALLAGVGMEALTLLWPLYAWLSHGFSAYGATFALFFLLATWLYLMSQLILLGAVANRMQVGQPRHEGMLAAPQPEPAETPGARAADEARRAGGRQAGA